MSKEEKILQLCAKTPKEHPLYEIKKIFEIEKIQIICDAWGLKVFEEIIDVIRNELLDLKIELVTEFKTYNQNTLSILFNAHQAEYPFNFKTPYIIYNYEQ